MRHAGRCFETLAPAAPLFIEVWIFLAVADAAVEPWGSPPPIAFHRLRTPRPTHEIGVDKFSIASVSKQPCDAQTIRPNLVSCCEWLWQFDIRKVEAMHAWIMFPGRPQMAIALRCRQYESHFPVYRFCTQLFCAKSHFYNSPLRSR
jgi:hypothetical protein